MTDDIQPLPELVAKAGDDDFLRIMAESVLQIVAEADVEGLIRAGRHERSGERTTWRMANGSVLSMRDWVRSTSRSQAAQRRILPNFLGPEGGRNALAAVIQE